MMSLIISHWWNMVSVGIWSVAIVCNLVTIALSKNCLVKLLSGMGLGLLASLFCGIGVICNLGTGLEASLLMGLTIGLISSATTDVGCCLAYSTLIGLVGGLSIGFGNAGNGLIACLSTCLVACLSVGLITFLSTCLGRCLAYLIATIIALVVLIVGMIACPAKTIKKVAFYLK